MFVLPALIPGGGLGRILRLRQGFVGKTAGSKRLADSTQEKEVVCVLAASDEVMSPVDILI